MYRRKVVAKESILVLNEIEKRAAENLFQMLASGSIPAGKKTNNTNRARMEISYEYFSTKNEQIIRGLMLDCPYRLRYRDSNRIFFSAWNCKDVCSVFYDVIMIIHTMAKSSFHFEETYREFGVDLKVKTYVFCTGQIAVSLVKIANFLIKGDAKTSYSSQYIFSVFEEPDNSVYAALLEELRQEGYSRLQILQIWIRGEILYYAMADDAVLRPEHQRSPTFKEEQDLIRKIEKATNNLSTRVEFS
jgi:hypothetical protein